MKQLWPFGFLFLTETNFAHERWVAHSVKGPINYEIFSHLGIEQYSIILRAVIFLIFTIVIWIKREKLEIILKKLISKSLGKKLNLTIDFFLDKTIYHDGLIKIVTLIQRFALRAPALVLIYSAATDSILMPSYPVHESVRSFFIGIQALFACFILIEFMLPVVGWVLIMICFYLFFAYGWVVGLDCLPIVGVGYMYITIHPMAKEEMLFVRENQIKIMKVIIGISFLGLGIMKIVNPKLPIGVADNTPEIMNDIFIRPFWIGTNPVYAREWWAYGFGISEILMGLLMASGIFQRFISLFICLVFTKLMVWDFGFSELPHIFAISILLLMGSSKIYKVQKDGIKHNRRKDDDKNLSKFRKIFHLFFPTRKGQ